MQSHPRILVTRRWPKDCEDRLRAKFDVVLNEDNHPMDTDSLRAAMSNFDAVLPTVTDPMGSEVFNADPMRCRFIGNFGVGYNHIDLESAKRLGIIVTNTPDVLTDCTADLAMMLVLMTARRASEGEQILRSGHWTGWHPTQLLGTKVTGKTLGLVGFGRIARATARRAHFGFGMKILISARRDIPPSDLLAYGASQATSLEALLRTSDFVSLHCPGSQENRHLINRERLALMKQEAILINTARGDVVDSEALMDALRSHQIRGAGLDVYEGEPKIHPGLLDLSNVTLLPHLGSATLETRTGMGMRVIDNLEAYFDHKAPGDRIC